MSVAVETEREFKFDVDAEFDPPDLRPVVGRTVRLPEVEHRTAYFDTADHRLWGCGITLRHRLPAGSDGDPGKWTLKLPEGDHPDGNAAGSAPSSRSELTWEGPAGSVPEPVRRILAGVVRRAPLGQVAELHATRRRLLLQEPDGDRPWAEIDDDLVEVASGPTAGRRFRQIELELVSGVEAPDGQVESVISLMRDAGAGPGGGSKLGAALGLADRPAAPAARPARSAPMGEVARHILSADLHTLIECDLELRRVFEDDRTADVELVHRTRVATRRVRSHLRTLDPLLDPVWVGHVRGDLRTLGQGLGRARDADVLLERIRAHTDAEDAAGVEELVHLVSADRALAMRELAAFMAGTAYSDLLERLSVAASNPPLYSHVHDDPAGLPAGRTLQDLVRQRWKRVTASVADMPARPHPDELHQLRIRAKRLRYAAEAAEPYVGRPARRAARAAKRLQDVLGEVHDATAAVTWLREMASHPSISPGAGFVAGRIAGRAEGSAAVAAARWRRTARRIGTKKLRASFG